MKCGRKNNGKEESGRKNSDGGVKGCDGGVKGCDGGVKGCDGGVKDVKKNRCYRWYGRLWCV